MRDFIITNHIRILFICIVILGFFLRFYKLNETFIYYGDPGRDLLVARHIILYDGFKFFHPSTNGGGLTILSSPVYYWILAVVWFFMRSALGVTAFFTLLGILIIFISYKTGILLHSRIVGLTASFFISINFLLIQWSQEIRMSNLLPFVSSLSFLLFLQSIKSTKPIWLLLFLITIFLGIHIHLSFLPVFLLGFGWVLYTNIVNLVNKKYILTIVNLLISGGLTYFWIICTYVKSPFDQFFFFKELIHGVNKPSLGFLEIIYSRYRTIFEGLFVNVPAIFIHILIISTCIGLIAFFLFDIKNKDSTNSSILLVIVFSVFLLSFYRAPNSSVFYKHYASAYYPIFLIILAYIINRIKFRSLSLFLVIFILCISLRGTKSVFDDLPVNYQTMYEINEHIYKDYLNNINSLTYNFVVLNNDLDAHIGFGQMEGSYWDLLELLSKKKLVQIISNDTNIYPLVQNPQTYYVVCVISQDEIVLSECIDSFAAKYGSSVKLSSMQSVYKIKNGSNLRYYVYKFKNKNF